MVNLREFRSVFKLVRIMFVIMTMSFLTQPLLAQHGHPLVGSWSGFLNRSEGQPIRALFTFDFSAEQVISGSVIANGRRFAITSASLDPDIWTITLNAEGTDRAGNMLSYRIVGRIDDLSSPTDRIIAGTWREGSNNGDFRVVIN